MFLARNFKKKDPVGHVTDFSLANVYGYETNCGESSANVTLRYDFLFQGDSVRSIQFKIKHSLDELSEINTFYDVIIGKGIPLSKSAEESSRKIDLLRNGVTDAGAFLVNGYLK